MKPTVRPLLRRGIVTLFLIVAWGQAETATADEVAEQVVNQFTPHLKKLLTVELHLIRKVCQPDAEQMAEIRRAGLTAVNDIARQYATLRQKNNRNVRLWPSPSPLLTAALQKKIDQILPEATAKRYRDEVAARFAARKEAVVEMTTLIIDRQICLTPPQYDLLAQQVRDGWDDHQTRNLQVLLFYEQYAPLPNERVLKPVLTERQQAIWQARANHGTVSFGEEQDLFGMEWFQGAELKDDDPREGAE